MKPRDWSPNLPEPNADKTRLEFISLMQRVFESKELHSRLFQYNSIETLAAYQILGVNQIAAIVQCTPNLVRKHLARTSLQPGLYRGELDPRALSTLAVVCRQLAIGDNVAESMLRELTRLVAGPIFTTLTGISLRTYMRLKASDENPHLHP